jgi:hypothetical protein
MEPSQEGTQTPFEVSQSFRAAPHSTDVTRFHRRGSFGKMVPELDLPEIESMRSGSRPRLLAPFRALFHGPFEGLTGLCPRLCRGSFNLERGPLLGWQVTGKKSTGRLRDYFGNFGASLLIKVLTWIVLVKEVVRG